MCGTTGVHPKIRLMTSPHGRGTDLRTQFHQYPDREGEDQAATRICAAFQDHSRSDSALSRWLQNAANTPGP